MPITYANCEGFEQKTPLSLCLEHGRVKFRSGHEICTYFLKTQPFYQWLEENYPVYDGHPHLSTLKQICSSTIFASSKISRWQQYTLYQCCFPAFRHPIQFACFDSKYTLNYTGDECRQSLSESERKVYG